MLPHFRCNYLLACAVSMHCRRQQVNSMPVVGLRDGPMWDCMLQHYSLGLGAED